MTRTLTAVPGNKQKLDGGALFGNAPKALWARWAEPDEQNRIVTACRAMLIEEPGRRILFETGIGAFFEPKLKERFGVVEPEHVLLSNLERLGISPDSIDIVVLSHLHFDHAGGLLSPYRDGEAHSLVFPRATFVVGAAAWERAQHPHARDRASFIPELNALLEASGRLHVVEGTDASVLGDGYRFHLSNGHTPGLLLTEVALAEGPVVFAGDLIPGVPWVHVPITMGYDRYPELVIDEKRALLEDLVTRNGRLFFTHDERVALGTVARDASGKFGIERPVDAPIQHG
ncbi:MAG: MBL fold metallo-hydrolase [Polyangiales bacterium]